MFKGKPKYNHRPKHQSRRRAYDVSTGESGLAEFNPNHIPQPEKIQAAIDSARMYIHTGTRQRRRARRW